MLFLLFRQTRKGERKRRKGKERDGKRKKSIGETKKEKERYGVAISGNI